MSLGSIRARRTLDPGFGKGTGTTWLAQRWGREARVIEADTSGEGIVNAMRLDAEMPLRHEMSNYGPLRRQLGAVTHAVCLEVLEPVYDTPALAVRVLEVLEPGGFKIVLTPDRGSVKSVATALLGRFEQHGEAAAVYGIIRLCSQEPPTLQLQQAGFEVRSFYHAGPAGPLDMSMIAIARRPSGASPDPARREPSAGEA